MFPFSTFCVESSPRQSASAEERPQPPVLMPSPVPASGKRLAGKERNELVSAHLYPEHVVPYPGIIRVRQSINTICMFIGLAIAVITMVSFLILQMPPAKKLMNRPTGATRGMPACEQPPDASCQKAADETTHGGN